MGAILQSLNLPYVNSSKVQQLGREPSEWILLPMKSTESKGGECVSDLTSSSLRGKLADALERTRELIKMTKTSTIQSANANANEAVLFLGMDSPELPMEEVVYGLKISSGDNRLSLQRHDEVPNHKSEHYNICIDNAGLETYGRAHLCPAGDGEFWGETRIAKATNVTAMLIRFSTTSIGGYGLLSIPIHAPSSKIFSGVRWSQPLTAVSQLKALTDSNVDVSIGKLMHDVDEPPDVHDLVKRLLLHSRNKDTHKNKHSKSQTCDILTSLSSGSSMAISMALPRPFPRHTRKVLVDMNLIQDDSAS